MTSALERLAAIMPLPNQGPATPWDRAPAEIGFQFPSDYRAFIDRYGAGEINEELTVYMPIEGPFQTGLPDGFRGYSAFARDEVGEAFKEARSEFPGDNPYPIYPEVGGLLVWGRTYNGDHLFWLTEDKDPDRWPVVVWLRHVLPPQWRPFDGGMVEFLLAVADRSYEHASNLIGGAEHGTHWTRTEDWARTYEIPGERDE